MKPPCIFSTPKKIMMEWGLHTANEKQIIMKTLTKILFLQFVLFGFLLSGCYNDFNDPEPYKIYTDADFADSQIVPIRTVKQLFIDKYGSGTTSVGKGMEITENYVIKGKVISNDAYGNVYRTMYIQDESGAIEVKIGTTGTYNEYKVGQTVFVKTQGLVIGSYRYMLSLGVASVDPSYANGYIDVKNLINSIIFRGERTKLTAADTLVVNSPAELNDDQLGCLLRINGLTSYYGVWDGDTYPSFLEQIDQVYTNYSFLSVINEWKAYDQALDAYEKNPADNPEPVAPKSPRPATLEYPTYAFNNENNRYYGTALFKFGAGAVSEKNQNLLVRSSGYARFSLDKLPANGTKANITAIYTKYSSKSGSYIKYQLLLNNVTDVEIIP